MARGILPVLATVALGIPAALWAQTPAVSPAPQSQELAQPQPVLRYKVKVSEGTAWTNLQPESWLIFDVSGGHTVVARHSTFVLNMITGVGRWWDHPATELRACRVSASSSGDQLSTCVRGESPTPGGPLQVVLPPGTGLQDVLFRVRWQERGQDQEATLRLPENSPPTVVNPP
ncbi:MAG: hypothetical protein VKP70_01295 [Cyanobacteriota bacterium]|nr:hypothetical protein [Cyanobacteriota bacterium]